MLRFWFDRGVDGFRIDSAALLAKDPGLADLARPRPGSSGLGGSRGDPADAAADTVHPFIDRDGVHEIYRDWRRIADSYPGPGADRRGLAGRRRSGSPGTCARTSCTPCSTSTSCAAPGTRPSCARSSTPRWTRTTRSAPRHLGALQPRRGPARHPLRPGRHRFDLTDRHIGEPSDLVLGTRRARAAALLTSRCPAPPTSTRARSSACGRSRTSPRSCAGPDVGRSGRTNLGRDGCRVPLPWSGGPRRSASARTAARPGCRSPPSGRTSPPRPRRRPRLHARAVPPRPAAAPGRARPDRQRPAGLVAVAGACWVSGAVTARAPSRCSSTCPGTGCRSPRTMRCCSPALHSRAACSPRTPPPGSAERPAATTPPS